MADAATGNEILEGDITMARMKTTVLLILQPAVAARDPPKNKHRSYHTGLDNS